MFCVFLFVFFSFLLVHKCAWRWVELHSSPAWLQLPWPSFSQSVLCVRAVCRLSVVGQHVVIHVDRGAVVDGVAEPLRQDGLTGVRRQAQQEEARLRRWEAVDGLRQRKERRQVSCELDREKPRRGEEAPLIHF